MKIRKQTSCIKHWKCIFNKILIPEKSKPEEILVNPKTSNLEGNKLYLKNAGDHDFERVDHAVDGPVDHPSFVVCMVFCLESPEALVGWVDVGEEGDENEMSPGSGHEEDDSQNEEDESDVLWSESRELGDFADDLVFVESFEIQSIDNGIQFFGDHGVFILMP